VGFGTTLKTPRSLCKKTHLPKNSTSHISLSTEEWIMICLRNHTIVRLLIQKQTDIKTNSHSYQLGDLDSLPVLS